MDYPLGKKGWFAASVSFAEAIGHVSNFPMSYVYALFMALSGHIIGRQAHIRYATPLYPNSFIALVGPSALSHKSTAMALAFESLESAFEDEMPTIHGISTSQGLLQAMLNGDGRALVHLDEMASLTMKTKQDFAADLLARIVELYGCPRIAGTYTRYEPIIVRNTFLTIIAGSTTEWLRGALTATDLMAGFGNRMTFVLGDPRPEVAWPKAPIWDGVDWGRLSEFHGACYLDENAKDVWEHFYAKFAIIQKKAYPFVRVLSERIPEKVLKTAMIISAWRETNIIDDDALERAIDWGRYLHKCVEKLAPTFENVERQVLAAIRDGSNSRQKLFGTLSHAHPAKRLKEAAESLKWLGFISEEGGQYVIA